MQNTEKQFSNDEPEESLRVVDQIVKNTPKVNGGSKLNESRSPLKCLICGAEFIQKLRNELL